MRKVNPKHLLHLFSKNIISKNEISEYIRDKAENFRLSNSLYFSDEYGKFDDDDFVIELNTHHLVTDEELRKHFNFKYEKPKDLQKQIDSKNKLSKAASSTFLENNFK